MQRKYISELKKGDIVTAHGGKFRILEDASESLAHRPMRAHLVQDHGPSFCAWAPSVCIEGEVQGYFSPGTEWRFQGNMLAGKLAII